MAKAKVPIKIGALITVVSLWLKNRKSCSQQLFIREQIIWYCFGCTGAGNFLGSAAVDKIVQEGLDFIIAWHNEMIEELKSKLGQ